MEKYKLVFVKKVGQIDSIYEYDFYFSENPDKFNGLGFDCEFANQMKVMPDPKTYGKVLRLKTNIPFYCMQNNNCFSMQHVKDGIVAVAFEDLSDYDDYPEPYRIVFKFGEEYSSVEAKLASRQQLFSE
jgi:hypothetical protein